MAALSPEPKHRVTPLGNGLYRVVTTVTVERTLTEAEMQKLGIAVPAPEVPWEPEQPAPVPPRRAYRTDSPVGQVMAYWRQHLGSGYDSRLPKQLPAWIDEFSIAGVLRAIDEVKRQDSREPKYLRLVHVLRRMREETAK